MQHERPLRRAFAIATVLALSIFTMSPAGSGQETTPKETPRALLERGAYAEEHQREFDAAAQLYAKAEEAAKAAAAAPKPAAAPKA